MRVRPGPAAAAVIVILGLLLVPAVLAHGNILAVDSQYTTEGTVELEGAYTLTGSWAVVYTDDGGSLGDPIGHTFLSPETFHTETTVAIDEAVWRNWTGARTVHVVMHNENGDGEFDADSDSLLSQGEDPVGGTISLARGERQALVAAEHLETPTITGTLTVRRVVMPADGRVVLHADGVSGQVVGEQALGAGTHADVTLAIDEEYYRYRGGSFTLTAALYSGGAEDPIDGTTRITAGDRPVATSVRLAPANTTTPTPTPAPDTTATATTAAATTTTDAEADGHDDEHDHDHEETTDGDATTETTESTTAAGDGTSATTAGGPETTPADAGGSGFGILAGLLAVVASALLLGARRP